MMYITVMFWLSERDL